MKPTLLSISFLSISFASALAAIQRSNTHLRANNHVLLQSQSSPDLTSTSTSSQQQWNNLRFNADPPTLTSSTNDAELANIHDEYIKEAVIKHVGCQDTIVVTYTPTIRVSKKICILPHLEEANVPGIASSSEVTVLNNENLCFDPDTVPLSEELKAGDKLSTAVKDAKFNYRSITMNIKEAAQGKTYVLKGKVVFNNIDKNGKVDKDLEKSEQDLGKEDYDLEKITEHLEKGIVQFTVDRLVDIDQGMISDNKLNRIETTIDKVEKKIPTALLIGGGAVAAAAIVAASTKNPNDQCKDWPSCNPLTDPTCPNEPWCKCKDADTLASEPECAGVVKGKHCEWGGLVAKACHLRPAPDGAPAEDPVVDPTVPLPSVTTCKKRSTCKEGALPSCYDEVWCQCNTPSKGLKLTSEQGCLGGEKNPYCVWNGGPGDKNEKACHKKDESTVAAPEGTTCPDNCCADDSCPKGLGCCECADQCCDKYDNGQMESPFGDDWTGCLKESVLDMCSQPTIWKGCEKTCQKCSKEPPATARKCPEDCCVSNTCPKESGCCECPEGCCDRYDTGLMEFPWHHEEWLGCGPESTHGRALNEMCDGSGIMNAGDTVKVFEGCEKTCDKCVKHVPDTPAHPDTPKICPDDCCAKNTCPDHVALHCCTCHDGCCDKFDVGMMKWMWDGWHGCDIELNNKEDCDVKNMVEGCQKTCDDAPAGLPAYKCPAKPSPEPQKYHKCPPQVDDPDNWDENDVDCDWCVEKLDKDGWCECLPIKQCPSGTEMDTRKGYAREKNTCECVKPDNGFQEFKMEDEGGSMDFMMGDLEDQHGAFQR